MSFALSRRQLPLALTAVFAMLWAIARAAVQAITIDEADTYLFFVARPWPSHWEPASNNHLLNSMLMRVFTSVFGPSQLTLRIPALIGAAIYILAAWYLCRLISRTPLFQWALFVCLVFNPFVFDYLVAARGYSLALAFLMCLIVAAASIELTVRVCALCSVFAALSFASNFSFGFVDAAAMLMVFLWACRRAAVRGVRAYARLLAAAVLPGLAVTVFLCASTMFGFTMRQLWYGSATLGEMVTSLVDATLYRLNPHIVNPRVNTVLSAIAPYLLPAAGVVWVLLLVWIVRARAWRKDAHARWLGSLGIVLAATGVLAVSLHWVALQLFRLPLPKDRTGLYLAPLVTLLAGLAAAVPLASRAGTLLRRAMVVMIFVLACYFLLCLRLSHFKQWWWDAEVNKAYPVLAYFNHTYGIKDVPVNWRYAAALNYYRVASGHESFSELVYQKPYPPGKPAYVLFGPDDQGVIHAERLKVVYKGDWSEVVVAVRPEAMK